MIGLVSYLAFFLTMAGIMAIVTLGLNLQWGYTGLFNGGVVAFFGAGAYGTMILGSSPEPGQFGGFELPYLVALLGGVLLAAALAWVVGLLTLRLKHDYLAISTFGVAVALESLARNAQWLTGGARGMRGFPRPFEDLIQDTFLYGLVFLGSSWSLLAWFGGALSGWCTRPSVVPCARSARMRSPRARSARTRPGFGSGRW
jgi:branched-chain amino acid transport system permease protein